jgi:hypothetical protein
MYAKEHAGEIKLPLGMNGELTSIELCEADEPVKILGELSNLALHWGEAKGEALLQAQRVAQMLRTNIPRYECTRVDLWDTLLESSVLYKLLCASLNEEEMYEVTQPAWTALKQKIGLARSTSGPLVRSADIGDIDTTYNVRRLVLLLRMLTTKHKNSRDAAETYMYNYLKRQGIAGECVLQTAAPVSKHYTGMW